MPRNRSLSLTVEEVQGRFDEWRRNRQRGAPIPKDLWMAAVRLARRDGVTRTATALHLDGGKLKRLMLAAHSPGAVSGNVMPPAFVELMSPPSASHHECMIELEGRHGKLRIHWNGATAADIVDLSRVLWEVAS